MRIAALDLGSNSFHLLVAMGRLTEHLERRRAAAREEFAERFAAYDTKATLRTFEELLDSAIRPS